jgi:NAD(P)-dependent dehydrogenase (short-subunit alcohol dehydrogenase family)
MNQVDLNGRNAVVTGGASGLGFAIAERLVASGAKVAIWDVDVDAAQAAGKQFGGSSIAADVSDLTSVTSAVQKTLGIVPTIDIFINNAGISGPNAKLWDYPVNDWKRIFAVNVEGTFYCCREVVPLMRERNYGRIVNIASVAGKDGNPNASAYSASKAAVIALTKSLGKELADTLVRVNCVTPAAVRTPLFAQMTQAVSTTCFRRSLWVGWGNRRRSPGSWLGWCPKNVRLARGRFLISRSVDRRIERPASRMEARRSRRSLRVLG